MSDRYRRQAIRNSWRYVIEKEYDDKHYTRCVADVVRFLEELSEEDRIWVVRQMEAWWMQ